MGKGPSVSLWLEFISSVVMRFVAPTPQHGSECLSLITLDVYKRCKKGNLISGTQDTRTLSTGTSAYKGEWTVSPGEMEHKDT